MPVQAVFGERVKAKPLGGGPVSSWLEAFVAVRSDVREESLSHYDDVIIFLYRKRRMLSSTSYKWSMTRQVSWVSRRGLKGSLAACNSIYFARYKA